MKASQKKATGQHGALEVRLNRALEETDKYKSALQKARIDLKVGVLHVPGKHCPGKLIIVKMCFCPTSCKIMLTIILGRNQISRSKLRLRD